MDIWECTVPHRLYNYNNSDSLFSCKDCESTKQGGFLTMTWGFHLKVSCWPGMWHGLIPMEFLCWHKIFWFYKGSLEESSVRTCLRWQGEERGSIAFKASSLPSADPIEISLTVNPYADIVNVRLVMAAHHTCPLHLQIHGPFITILHASGWH